MLLFLLASIIPAALIAAAAFLGAPWPWVALLGGVPCALFLDGTGLTAPKDRKADGLVLALTTLLGLAHLTLMPLVIWGLVKLWHGHPLQAVALFLAAGVYFGQVANANAHELIHMTRRWPRRLGITVYSWLLFGHHDSAHRLVHHIHVASDADPNSARAGESFYAFWLRAWTGSFRAAWAAVNAKRARANPRKPAWTHPFLGYGLGAAAALAMGWAVGGVMGVIAWIALCLYAQMQLLLADYVQHYGLRRAELADGRLEPVSARHSWNAPQVWTAAMMLNAPRHSDHHMNPARSFPELQLDRDAMPILPASLPAMAFIAMIPPLWRNLMDPLLQDWRSAAVPRHKPAQEALARARSHSPAPRDLPKSVHASNRSDSPFPSGTASSS